MSPIGGTTLRDKWIANAKKLEEKGYFARYSPQLRAEVLKKGFLGSYPPDQAIKMAQAQVERGYGFRTSKFNDEMRVHFGVVGAEVRDKLLQILDETPPEAYEPPFELKDPAGFPFIFDCSILGCEIFFKFQIAGTARKPQVLFWSCHPPVYGIKKEKL